MTDHFEDPLQTFIAESREPLQQQLADSGGVSLAAGRFHDGSDDRSGGLHLAVLDLGDGVSVGGNRVVDGGE